MRVKVCRKAIIPVVLREICCNLNHYFVSDLYVEFEVENFITFVRAVYKTYAWLSRFSEVEGHSVSICMKLPITVEVNGMEFFLRVEEGGVRYGRK